jgi:outer membrane receptor protein involved in Fe transport
MGRKAAQNRGRRTEAHGFHSELEAPARRPFGENMTNRLKISSILLATAAVIAPAAPALAQSGDGEIVVTGSRVVSNGNNMPTPVTVVSTQALLEAQPASVVQALNTVPALIGSLNSTSNVNSGGYNQLNLRGVGATRALVLFNGHRLGPTRAAGQTNVDVVPQLLLQRVDVVTGGASAVYGSDAVSGVVNFITDPKFNGVKAEIQGGISTYGDDDKFRTGVAFGKQLDDRTHFEASYEFNHQTGFNREDRDFWTPNYTMQGSVVQPVGGVTSAAGTALNPYALVRDARISTASWGGRINNGPLADLNFASNGVLTPFNHGTRTGTSGVELGGDGAYFINNTASTSQTIHRGFARFDYELSSNVRAYIDAGYTNLTQGFRLQNPTLNLTIGYANPFLDSVTVQSPTVSQALFNSTRTANPTGSFTFSKIDTQLPNYQARVESKYSIVSGGLAGDYGPIGWTADYSHTDSQDRLTNLHNLYAGKLLAAVNAVRDSTGKIVCNAALINPAAYGDCVPLNVFGPTSANQAAMDYINTPTTALVHYKGDDITGTLKASPFELPAGPVNVALSGEWRKLTLETISNVSPTDVVDCRGIQFGCASPTATAAGTTAYLSPNGANATASRTPVSQTVKEISIEAAVPLIADMGFVQSLDVNGAARYTDYDTSGSVTTWKVGGVARLGNALTLRATQSRDIRAPNLNDLFAPLSLAPRSYTDTHTGGTTGFVSSQTQGNAGLTPEKADTFTAGVVFRPDFFPGFSVTVDYYNIKINDAIVNVDPLQGNTQATCELSGGTDAVCALYVRPLPFSNRTAANYPTLLLGQSLNVASLKTYGIDYEVNYAHEVGDGRNLNLRVLLNWQPHLVYNNGPSGIIDIGGAADGIGGLPITPKYKLLASASYDITSKLRVLVQERWRDKLKQNGSAAVFFAAEDVESVAYTDINFNYKVNEAATAFFNVQNLFDKAPAPFASNGGSSQPNYLGGFAQGDDLEGRYFTTGLRLRF